MTIIQVLSSILFFVFLFFERGSAVSYTGKNKNKKYDDYNDRIVISKQRKIQPKIDDNNISCLVFGNLLGNILQYMSVHEQRKVIGISKFWYSEITHHQMVSALKSPFHLKSFISTWPFRFPLPKLIRMTQNSNNLKWSSDNDGDEKSCLSSMERVATYLVERVLAFPGSFFESELLTHLEGDDEFKVAMIGESEKFFVSAVTLFGKDSSDLDRYLQLSCSGGFLEWLLGRMVSVSDKAKSLVNIPILRIAIATSKYGGNVKIFASAVELYTLGGLVDSLGDSLLRKACAHGFLDLAKYLVAKGVSPDPFRSDHHHRNEVEIRTRSPLMEAIANNQVEIVKWLVTEIGARDVRTEGYIYQAIRTGHYETVKILLKLGFKPTQYRHQSPLTLAIKKDRIDLVTLLLDHRTMEFFESPLDPPQKKPHECAVYAAIECGNLEICKLLFERGFDASALAYFIEDEKMAQTLLGKDLYDLVRNHYKVKEWVRAPYPWISVKVDGECESKSESKSESECEIKGKSKGKSISTFPTSLYPIFK